jgi:hypothetical protein
MQPWAQLEIEHNNMRVVLGNATADDEAGRFAAHVAASIGLFWFLGNYFSEARHWWNLVLSLESAEGDPAVTWCLAFDGFIAASFGRPRRGIAAMRPRGGASGAARRRDVASLGDACSVWY